MTIFPVTAIINEKATVCLDGKAIDTLNETVKGAIVARRNSPFCALFHVLLFH